MKKKKKPIRFYVLLLLFMVVFTGGYTAYMVIAEDVPVSEFYTLWALPFLFVGVYLFGDRLTGKFASKKETKDFEALFLDAISEKMRESGDFTIEDFRRLQENPKFQKYVQIAYYIHRDDDPDIDKLHDFPGKFKDGSKEQEAMRYVIDFIEETKKHD